MDIRNIKTAMMMAFLNHPLSTTAVLQHAAAPSISYGIDKNVYHLSVTPKGKKLYFTILLQIKQHSGWSEIDGDILRPNASLAQILDTSPGKNFECFYSSKELDFYNYERGRHYRFALKYGYSLNSITQKVYSAEFTH